MIVSELKNYMGKLPKKYDDYFVYFAEVDKPDPTFGVMLTINICVAQVFPEKKIMVFSEEMFSLEKDIAE